jgi:hypothetical protein
VADLNERLEKELWRQLVPVSAPEGLWQDIRRHQSNGARWHPAPRAALDWAFWPVAVAMVLLALGGIVRAFGSRVSGDRELMAMARNSDAAEYRSGNFDDIRTWVKDQADIDIDLPAGRSGTDKAVRVLGARLLRVRGVRVAAIDYRVGTKAATLFVTGKDAGNVLPREESAADRGLYSWNLRDETYLVSYTGPQASREACLLCHPAGMQ